MPLMKFENKEECVKVVADNLKSLKRINVSSNDGTLAKNPKIPIIKTVSTDSTPADFNVGPFKGITYNSKIFPGNQAIKINYGNSVKITKCSPVTTTSNSNGVIQPGRRPTIFIQGPSRKPIRATILELIEKNPKLHLGVSPEHLNILKAIFCTRADVSYIDLCIALKKIRCNEDFSLLSEYFEYSQDEIIEIFVKTIKKLEKYMKLLIRWPERQKYYDRHKNLPMAYRTKLSFVQTIVDCVETEIRTPSNTNLDNLQCKNYKFILAMSPSGVIYYISEAYIGNNDDITIFNACNFKNVIPKYLSLVADPGETINYFKNNPKNYSMTDSVSEDIESNEQKTKKTTKLACGTMSVANRKIKSFKVKDFSIPTLYLHEADCRQQIKNVIEQLREFKILQPYALLESNLYSYINEILIVASALLNLQR